MLIGQKELIYDLILMLLLIRQDLSNDCYYKTLPINLKEIDFYLSKKKSTKATRK